MSPSFLVKMYVTHRGLSSSNWHPQQLSVLSSDPELIIAFGRLSVDYLEHQPALPNTTISSGSNNDQRRQLLRMPV